MGSTDYKIHSQSKASGGRLSHHLANFQPPLGKEFDVSGATGISLFQLKGTTGWFDCTVLDGLFGNKYPDAVGRE